MITLNFDPDNTLAGGLYALSPREAIRLAVGLCEAAEAGVGPDGSHGAIWPGNISVLEGQVTLGPRAEGAVADLFPDALEFIAPEQFWNGSATPASDVYSIGLVLYTALNGGVMPFFTPEAEHTPGTRAVALQKRMKGAPLAPPRSAGRELSALVAKAVAFHAEDRYETPAVLRLALEALPEGAMLPAVAPFMPLTEEEVRNAHSYKVDKDFEPITPARPPRPPRRRRHADEVDEDMDIKKFRSTKKRTLGPWILPLMLAGIILAAAVFLLWGGQDYDPLDNLPLPSGTPTQEPGTIHPPVDTSAPLVSETPAPDPTPTAPPEPSAPPAPRYEIFMADVSWTEASALCAEKGGHLATVRNAEQLAEVIQLAKDKGASFVWLGAYRDNNNRWLYVTGEPLDYYVWDQGEPSATDMDGTPENQLLLWYKQKQGTWSYNDMRDDPLSVAYGSYHGKLAYVCQYDD